VNQSNHLENIEIVFIAIKVKQKENARSKGVHSKCHHPVKMGKNLFSKKMQTV